MISEVYICASSLSSSSAWTDAFLTLNWWAEFDSSYMLTGSSAGRSSILTVFTGRGVFGAGGWWAGQLQ